MTHIEETELSVKDKVVDAATIAFGLAMLPVMIVICPRVAVSCFRESTAISLNTPANASFFNENRLYSDADKMRVKAFAADLKAKMDKDDWTGVSKLLAETDRSREVLQQSNARLADVALDFIRHELADAVYGPTMCNNEGYYEVLDEALARVDAASRANPADPYLTALLAQLHIDRGWCLRGGGWSHEVSEEGWRGLMASFETAHYLLQRFDPRELGSPLYGRVKFQLLVTAEAEHGLDTAREAYQEWSDMDIGNPLAHRSFAFFALPRWFGDWESFDAEARAAAKRTRFATGKAAYATFYLEAFDYDEHDALIYLDIEDFGASLDDLIRHDPDPVGRALKVAVTLRNISEVHPMTIIGEVLGRARVVKRKQLRGLIRQILDTHVTHLAAREGSGFERRVLTMLSETYHAELKQDARLTFTPDGIRMVPAEQDAP